jgi:hypothetical protein
MAGVTILTGTVLLGRGRAGSADPVWVVWFLLALGLLFAVALAIGALRERRRREALQGVADELGFQFGAKDEERLAEALSGALLFQRGHSRRVSNVLRGGPHAHKVRVFDYRFVTGHGKHRSTHNQTVAAYPWKDQPLPEFELRPEGVWDRIAGVFGYQDIDIPDHPQFSKQYVLRGRDEECIRSFFTDRLVSALEEAPGLRVEACAGWLLVYHARRRVAPLDVATFLEAATGAYEVFRRG